MKNFYLMYPIWQTVSAKLSWPHYCALLRVEKQSAREWYMKETIENVWSVRALERQIDKLYYERLLSSKDKQPVIDEANTHIEPLKDDPKNYLRDPYILDFLNLPHASVLESNLEEAQTTIAMLNRRGRGIKILDEKEWVAAVDTILKKHKLQSLLHIEYRREEQKTLKKATRKREAYILVETSITAHTTLNQDALEDYVAIGYAPALSIEEAILAYRQEYLIEHGFARYKGKVLGLTPIYLSSATRIKGLVRLLSIGLRILRLLELSVREALQHSQETLSGIYKGNPKRATVRPTAEMMLKVFRGISLVTLTIHGVKHRETTPLTPIQNKILVLLGLSPTYYTALCKTPCK